MHRNVAAGTLPRPPLGAFVEGSGGVRKSLLLLCEKGEQAGGKVSHTLNLCSPHLRARSKMCGTVYLLSAFPLSAY